MSDARPNASRLELDPGVDRGRPLPVDFAPPVADWIAFLADLLAAEFLRELHEGPAA
jgi:hypothetical protein